MENNMLQTYYQGNPLNLFSGSVKHPLGALVDLNLKSLQHLSQFIPAPFVGQSSPEQIWEKHIELLVQNSNATLSYVQSFFGIIEKQWSTQLGYLASTSPSPIADNQGVTTHIKVKKSKTNSDSSKKSKSSKEPGIKAKYTKTSSDKSNTSTAQLPTSKAAVSVSARKKPVKHSSRVAVDLPAPVNPVPVITKIVESTINPDHTSLVHAERKEQ
jgi:hypothetical protein